MSKKKYSAEEMAAWKRGKIAGYYSNKARERRHAHQASQREKPVKYSQHTAEDALIKALERSYSK